MKALEIIAGIFLSPLALCAVYYSALFWSRAIKDMYGL